MTYWIFPYGLIYDYARAFVRPGQSAAFFFTPASRVVGGACASRHASLSFSGSSVKTTHHRQPHTHPRTHRNTLLWRTAWGSTTVISDSARL